MPYFLFALAFLCAIADWVAVARHHPRLGYFTKPGVMLALLLWVALHHAFSGPMLCFAVGLVFALIGDVFLMLPQERLRPAMAAFWLTHLSYGVGFNLAPLPLGLPYLALFLVVWGCGAVIFRRIAAELQAKGEARLKLPALLYSTAISLMLLSALTTLLRPEWSLTSAFITSGGALLFYLSDTRLAWHRFVAPLSYGRLRVRITYHLGQLLIVLGAALHFLGGG